MVCLHLYFIVDGDILKVRTITDIQYETYINNINADNQIWAGVLKFLYVWYNVDNWRTLMHFHILYCRDVGLLEPDVNPIKPY